ncbi:membrane protein insertase YidC [Pseudonocardia kongjuensis]|uniref:Membrane protein insertase YidC n=1 Tax=Pseudonocardia kongjuensis TaxID=102227 RepID=A0ABP4I417_9PSEU
MLDVLYYPVSLVMRLWHDLFAALLGPTSGVAWALSVVFLVLTVRALLLRPAWTRMRAARITRALAPQLSALRERHRSDPRALAAATTDLHRRHGSSPVAGLGTALLQIPVFVALLHVLRSFNRPGLSFEQNAMIANYAFDPDQVASFLQARLFGAPLSAWTAMPAEQLASFGGTVVTPGAVAAVVVPLAVLAALATHLSMRFARAEVTGQPAGVARVTAVLPWVAPAAVLAGGLLFPVPVALLLYWTTGGVATLVQQVVLGRMLDRRPPSVPEPVPVAPPVRAPRPGARPVTRSAGRGRGRRGRRTGKDRGR